MGCGTDGKGATGQHCIEYIKLYLYLCVMLDILYRTVPSTSREFSCKCE